MKKLGTLVSGLLLTVAITACGTANVNDVNDPRRYDVNRFNQPNVYDVNYRDVNDVYDGGNRNIFNNRMGDSPLRNNPDVTDDDNRIFDADRDDTFFDDEEMNPAKSR